MGKQASTVNKTAIAAGPGLGAGRMFSVSASVISVLSVISVFILLIFILSLSQPPE